MRSLSGQLIPAGVALALLIGWGVLELTGVGSKSAEPQPPTRKRDEFASDRKSAPAAAASPAKFDGSRALGYVKDLCQIGPRVSGTEGMARQQELVKAHFEKLGGKVQFQRFTAKQPSRSRPVDLVNVIVSWQPQRDRRVILCTHYDTRPKADQEENPRKWNEPFLSANDGTSGVAWLMELAHHMKDLPTTVGVDFVLFDGEEYVFDGPLGQDPYFLGSDHFADEYRRTAPKHKYTAAVLLDLFAGKRATYPVEQNSAFQARALVNEIWSTAAELGVTAFRNQMGPIVRDDHLALNRVGIPAVDIIDFDYPHWHRLTDLPDQCSAESMEQVARVLTVWLQRAK